jgi:replicative DNA helicase
LITIAIVTNVGEVMTVIREAALHSEMIHIGERATKMTIEATQTAEDVQSIYRVNKSTYERLKAEFPTDFAELLDLFKARKEELK